MEVSRRNLLAGLAAAAGAAALPVAARAEQPKPAERAWNAIDLSDGGRAICEVEGALENRGGPPLCFDYAGRRWNLIWFKHSTNTAAYREKGW
jgi:hypothetical protein